MERNFQELAINSWRQGLFGCLGLDPDINKLPLATGKSPNDIRRINRFLVAIVDKAKDVVGFFKPNLAFFERYGSEGIQILRDVVGYIKATAPDRPIILDAKKNEIGNSNLGYVDFVFDYLGVDAVTVNPYLGLKALAPFFQRREKGIIALCRTSNEQSDEFQNLPVKLVSALKSEFLTYNGNPEFRARLDKSNYVPFYWVVAHRLAVYNSEYKNVGMVFGATYPVELEPIRPIVGDMPILLPGIGAQSKTGNLEQDLYAILKPGYMPPNGNIIINVSRAALYASNGDDYAQKCREYFVELNSIIKRWRYLQS
jgi:orotidine-5'-phosphate decarboxylase